MNQRESTGLPLRAAVMVLLFLGVVFLLVALQAVKSSGDDTSQPSTPTTTSVTTTSATSTSPGPAVKPEVRVYNVSDVTGAADSVATKLTEAQWTAKAENLTLNELPPESTVYYGSTPGEEDAAKEVGTILGFPAAQRLAELADQPPGVIVVITG